MPESIKDGVIIRVRKSKRTRWIAEKEKNYRKNKKVMENQKNPEKHWIWKNKYKPQQIAKRKKEF